MGQRSSANDIPNGVAILISVRYYTQNIQLVILRHSQYSNCQNLIHCIIIKRHNTTYQSQSTHYQKPIVLFMKIILYQNSVNTSVLVLTSELPWDFTSPLLYNTFPHWRFSTSSSVTKEKFASKYYNHCLPFFTCLCNKCLEKKCRRRCVKYASNIICDKNLFSESVN